MTPEERRGIELSPAAKFACNYGGRGKDGEGYLVKPTHWTSYDPTPSWSPQLFRDPSITKFLKRGKEMDLVPNSLDKACDCPATFFIQPKHVSFTDFFPEAGVNDSRDTMVQAMAIAVALGFRNLYMIGTELVVRPSEAQRRFAEGLGVSYPVDTQEGRKSDLLDHFIQAVAAAMEVSRPEATKYLEGLDREEQYAISEMKPLKDAALTDWHYWERVQYLRLAKRNLTLRGVNIVSCTPDSRLNQVFEYKPVGQVCLGLSLDLGSIYDETTEGKYTKRPKFAGIPWHRDVRPYGWEGDKKPAPAKETVVKKPAGKAKPEGLKGALADMAKMEVAG